jgi:putative acetyltransferase
MIKYLAIISAAASAFVLLVAFTFKEKVKRRAFLISRFALIAIVVAVVLIFNYAELDDRFLGFVVIAALYVSYVIEKSIIARSGTETDTVGGQDRSYSVRNFEPGDADACYALYRNTVRECCAADYTGTQIDALAPKNVNAASWRETLMRHVTLVAVHKGRVVAFADMDDTGYLGRIAVRKDFQRNGIGTDLFGRLEAAAPQGILTSATLTAVPFFEKLGFENIEKRDADHGGIPAPVVIMQKK